MSTPEEAQKPLTCSEWQPRIDGRVRQPRRPRENALVARWWWRGGRRQYVAAVVGGGVGGGRNRLLSTENSIPFWGPGFSGPYFFHFGCVLFPGQWVFASHGPEHQEQL